jgi:uncharacterized membrane protein
MVNIKLLECILQEYAVAVLSSAIQIKTHYRIRHEQSISCMHMCVHDLIWIVMVEKDSGQQ